MFFGLGDVFQFISGQNLSIEASNAATDMVHTLVSKVLQTPLLTTMKWLSTGIQPALVFHLVGRILEGNASLFSHTVAQATANLPSLRIPKKRPNKQQSLRRRPLRVLTHTPQTTMGQPHLTTHENLWEQLIYWM